MRGDRIITNLPIPLVSTRTEAQIMETWEVRSQPVVSICCATYNHRHYIEEAIHGLLAQITNFPFEIVIRDDASTDGTTDVVREYAQRYPQIIRTIIEPKNQFQKGVRPLHAWPSLARGEFIALCEGDDFWITPDKLQNQVELLRKHPEAVICVALSHFCQQNGDKLDFLKTTTAPSVELLGFDEVHRNYFHTSTYLIPSRIFNMIINDYFSGHSLFGDTALRAILVSKGKFALLPEAVSVYRITGDGIWSSLNRERQLKWEIDAATKLATMLTGVHKEYQRDRLFVLLKSMLQVKVKNGAIFDSLKYFSLFCLYRIESLFRFIWRSDRD